MTMEQQHNTLKEQLTQMGYSDVDAERAVVAGAKDAYQAVDFLSKTPTKSALEDTAMNFPALSDARVTSTTSSPPAYGIGSQIRGIANARDSLDRIPVNRISDGDVAAPGQTGGDVRMTKDYELERVLEESAKEQDERDIAQALELSKKEEAASRPGAQDQDPEYLRAIEESLKAGPPPAAPDRAVSFQSQGYADVKEWMRQSVDEPVGLKNIGNTCYLNSLLQVYFHLPDFRRAIMAFRPPDVGLDASLAQTSFHSAQVPYQQPVAETPPVPYQQPIVEAPQAPYQQPVVDAPGVEGVENESPYERLERTIAASQMDQSFDRSLNGDELIKGPDGASGISGNHFDPQGGNSAVLHALHFVVELQKLFASMALGTENCADPSGVAHTMRDPNGYPIVIGAQQDAYEFNHLFLDIVEKGLKSETHDTQFVLKEKDDTSEAPTSTVLMEDSKVPENIVKDMFTVRFRQELRPCPSDRTGPGHDREYPVTNRQGETSEIVVNATSKDYRNLHSGLDDYAFASIEYEMSQSFSDMDNSPSNLEPAVAPPLEVVDGRDSGASPTALKSVWFTRMPPVVVIYLQRATYNKETSQAEKVHERYDFPCEISFDRYLQENKEASIRARGVVQRIRREQERLHALLQRYRFFPHSERSNDQVASNNEVVDMDVSESGLPEPNEQNPWSHLTKAKDYSQRPGSQSLTEKYESIFDAAARVQARLLESVNASSQLFAVEGLCKDRVEASVEVLNTIVEHDRKQCDTFEANLRTLSEQERNAYQGLDKTKYRLHAVLVHDGAPSGGHYWTFIRNWNATSGDLLWMRLSDSSVSYVTEEDMLSWSVGGKSRASAYCLIYAADSTLESKYKSGESISEESRRLLPAVRIEEVERASADFAREVQEYELARNDK